VLDSLGISYSFKQWMAVLIGGAAGLAAFVGCTMLLHRRLSDPRIRNNSTFADIGILALLWVQIVVGMGTIVLTLQHMDGAKMLQFMNWSQSVMALRINAWQEVVDVHWLYKLHIFLGMVILVLFPFTRLVHMLSIPVRFLWRPGYQIVRSRRGAKPVRTGLKPFAGPQAGPSTPPKPAAPAPVAPSKPLPAE